MFTNERTLAVSETGHGAAPMPMLERRRIEAGILKHVYDVLVDSHGRDFAQKVIGDAVRAASVRQGAEFAARVGGRTNIATFVDIMKFWTMEDALRIDMLRQDETHLEFNVTKCRYADMYREMGLGEIGHLLSCQRDGTFCEGYDPNLTLERSQTIMQGASHCDFRYRRKPDPA